MWGINHRGLDVLTLRPVFRYSTQFGLLSCVLSLLSAFVFLRCPLACIVRHTRDWRARQLSLQPNNLVPCANIKNPVKITTQAVCPCLPYDEVLATCRMLSIFNETVGPGLMQICKNGREAKHFPAVIAVIV